MTRQVGNWVSYELKPRGVECHFFHVLTTYSMAEKKEIFAKNCDWRRKKGKNSG